MVNYQVYNEIRYLYLNKNMSCEMIASQLQLNLRTVKKWAVRENYEGRKARIRSSILDPYKSAIRLEFELGDCTATFIYNKLKEVGYPGGYTVIKKYLRKLRDKSSDTEVNPLLPFNWMLRLILGEITTDALTTELAVTAPKEDIVALLQRVCGGSLRDRKRAVAVLAHLRNIPTKYIARFIIVDKKTAGLFLKKYRSSGITGLFAPREGLQKRHEQEYKSAVFTLLHSPPQSYGINRTTWRMDDLMQMLRQQGILISKDSIRRIIRNAGYRLRKAKRVLTSPDPEYREKVELVLNTLQNLKPDELFFFIDEMGPIRVKKYGGNAIVHKDDVLTYPQIERHRGSITMAAALSATTNQVTWLYGPKKDSQAMIDLIEILFNQYPKATRIYLTWDAASWHSSNQLVEWLDAFNAATVKSLSGPVIQLVPLPPAAFTAFSNSSATPWP